MCLQCICKSIPIGNIGEISIQISNRDNLNWPKDTIGLIFLNDPFLIFKNIPLDAWEIDPYFEIPDEILDTINIPNEQTLIIRHVNCMNKMEKGGEIDPMLGYKLIKNLMADGYKPDVHGYAWASYLCHKIAIFLKEKKDDPVFAIKRLD